MTMKLIIIFMYIILKKLINLTITNSNSFHNIIENENLNELRSNISNISYKIENYINIIYFFEKWDK